MTVVTAVGAFLGGTTTSVDRMAGNNLNLATEFLLASPILVQRARDEDSARNQSNASASELSTENTNLTTAEPSGSNSNNENLESTPDEPMCNLNDGLRTEDSSSTTLSSSINPPASSADSDLLSLQLLVQALKSWEMERAIIIQKVKALRQPQKLRKSSRPV
ncbi:hypothetical protein BY996DRAFT_6422043 [Phakopsora pachyrhizi]|uniref:Uncharacterized protein n=1 Tax=Phakopsora pachyrhizi TaxID=170000 RepID=A0AAV0B4R4_PHAPC|nr:hypothetical protein BY996DRAFT_6422043 [Phakopsora pachyrhizi]CAH7681606.1 hypothetical protein PPACK8108_LOCUS14225 [Phakopsora pachyrhizi]